MVVPAPALRLTFELDGMQGPLLSGHRGSPGGGPRRRRGLHHQRALALRRHGQR